MSETDRAWQAVDDEDDVPYVAVRRGVLYQRRRVSRALPVAVGIVGLAAAFLGEYLVVLPSVENQLQDRVTTALHNAGFNGLRVSVDGRDVTLDGTLPTAADVDKAVAVVQHVNGVRVIKEVFVSTAALPSPAPSPSPSPSVKQSPDTTVAGASTSSPAFWSPPSVSIPVAPPTLPAALDTLVSLGAAIDDGRVILVGALPSTGDQRTLVTDVSKVFGADKVVDRTIVDGAVGGIGTREFGRAVVALGPQTIAGAISLQQGRLRVAGVVRSSGVGDAASAAVRKVVASGPFGVQKALTVSPATTQATDAEVAAQLWALPSVPFVPGQATLEAQADRIVGLMAELLKARGSLAATIEGDVSTQDGDGAAAADLSGQQAAAVVAALQSDGVPGSHLDVRAFGATRPRVTGSSAVADAWNRRVVLAPRSAA